MPSSVAAGFALAGTLGLVTACGLASDSVVADEQLDRCYRAIEAAAEATEFDLGPDDELLVERNMAACLEDPARDALQMECAGGDGQDITCMFEEVEGPSPVINLSEVVRERLAAS